MKQEEKELKQTEFRKKVPKWFYAVPFLIPVIFFILLETALQILDYGDDYSQFVEFENYPDKYFLNPRLPLKYFSNLNSAPGVINDAFDKEKEKNTYRIFVLGGSSTAGWPYVPNASFSRQLKRRLELLYPETKFEVINCGISAINTYTIRDIVPGIIKQNPDLVLIYAGHNEYYGALGVGSAVSMGQSRFIKNAYIALMDFKTTRLTRDFIQWIYGLFSADEKIDKANNETLMGRMIGESIIPFNSENFKLGLEQFEENYRDILEYLKDAEIPVITGTLTMNIKDLPPFVSVKEKPAVEVFNSAKEELKKGNIKKAKELFVLAKELDALRFRAPEKINETIIKLSDEFGFPAARIDVSFDEASENNIVGYNLTVDHLHPNEEGYRLIAETFFKKMEEKKLLPDGKKLNISYSLQDSLLAADNPLTRLDSVIAELRLAALTGSYPFAPKGQPNFKLRNFEFKNWVDSVAISVVNLDVPWATAHNKIAERYFELKDYKNFAREMNAIIEDRPVNTSAAEYTATKLIDAGQILLGEYFLKKLHRQEPSFFTYKWLGQIALERKNFQKAYEYLKEAAAINSEDAQLLYNLAGTYYYKGEVQNALKTVEKSLSINSNNPQAMRFYEQLKTLLKQQ